MRNLKIIAGFGILTLVSVHALSDDGVVHGKKLNLNPMSPLSFVKSKSINAVNPPKTENSGFKLQAGVTCKDEFSRTLYPGDTGFDSCINKAQDPSVRNSGKPITDPN